MAGAYRSKNSGFIIEAHAVDHDSGESIDLSNSVVEIDVSKNFATSAFPLFKIGIQTTKKIRDQLRDDEFSLSLKVMAYDAIQDENVSETGENSSAMASSVVFDDMIRIYDKPYDASTMKKEEETDESDGESRETSMPNINYAFYGIPEHPLSKNETVVNAVFKNAELSDALAYLLSSTDNESAMKVQPLDNKEMYRSILVPPVSIIPALRYLDDHYSFYENHPARIFYDSTAFYMYDPFSANCPRDNALEMNVTSSDDTGSIETDCLPKVDDDGNVKAIMKSLPAFSSNEKTSLHAMGSYPVFCSYDERFSLLEREQEHPESYTKMRYFWNPLGSKMFEDMTYETASKTMSVMISNLEPSYITPLTEVRVISSEYPEAAGDYFILNEGISFTSSDKIHFADKIMLQLIKK